MFPTTDSCAATPSRAPEKGKERGKKRAWSQGRPQRTHPTGQVVLGYVQIVVKKRYLNFQGWLHPEPGCIINLEMILGQHERSSKKKQNKDIHRPSIEAHIRYYHLPQVNFSVCTQSPRGCSGPTTIPSRSHLPVSVPVILRRIRSSTRRPFQLCRCRVRKPDRR